jgi:hypothetical protein
MKCALDRRFRLTAEGFVFLHPGVSKVSDEPLLFDFEPDHFIECVPTHLLAVGDEQSLVAEASRFCDTPVVDVGSYFSLTTALNCVIKVIQTVPVEHLSFPDMLKCKDKKGSTGEGYNFVGNFGVLLGPELPDGTFTNQQLLFDHVKFLISSLRDPNLPFPLQTFSVFLKTDKYALAKILNHVFRTIQAMSLGLHMLMLYYFFFAEKRLKTIFRDQVLVGILTSEVPDRYGWDEMNSYSIGYDFTAMDRSESSTLIFPIIRAFGRHMGQHIADYFAFVITFGMLTVTPTLSFWRSGGNPSGQYLTTMVNCLIAIYLHTATLHHLGWLPTDQILCDNPVDSSGKTRWLKIRIVGDDGLIMAKDKSVLIQYKEALDFIISLTFYTEGTGIKWDSVIAPPGVGSVFLDTFIGLIGGIPTQVPSRFIRSVPRCLQTHSSPLVDVYRGLLDRCSIILAYLAEHGFESHTPNSIRRVISCAKDYNVSVLEYDAVLSTFVLGNVPITSSIYA